MPDFDDEEYESFELEGKGERTPARHGGWPKGREDETTATTTRTTTSRRTRPTTRSTSCWPPTARTGSRYVQALTKDLANDLDELIVQLRRLPGDAGAIGFVSLVEEVFVIARVRGQHVQVLLSDGDGGRRVADRPRRGRLSR